MHRTSFAVGVGSGFRSAASYIVDDLVALVPRPCALRVAGTARQEPHAYRRVSPSVLAAYYKIVT